VLSGTGGDEFTGGVPTSAPELSDLLMRLQFGFLAHQLKLWALSKRKPWPGVLWEAVRDFLPAGWLGPPAHNLPTWLHPHFVRSHRAALRGYQRRLKLFGGLPSFQHSHSTLNLLRRQLACSLNAPEPLLERRYPYLDRDLVEFLCAIPCEQLVRPNQRRSLMRRALVGFVPDEVLNRRRKAFLVRSPIRTLCAEWHNLAGMGRPLMADSLEIVNHGGLTEALQKAHAGTAINVVIVQRTLLLERWLRHLAGQRFLRIWLPKLTTELTT